MPRGDHDDLKSGGPKDLSTLKQRLSAKSRRPPSPKERAATAKDEIAALKDIIRMLYNDAISTEDARDFTLGVQDQLGVLIRSWGEELMTPEEYMAAQEAAQERARDLAEIERLKRKHKLT